MHRRLLIFSFVVVLGAQIADYAHQGEAAVAAMAAGQFATVESHYDAAMARAMPPGKLAAIWAAVEGQAGAYRSTEKSTVATSGTYHTAIVTCHFAKADLELLIAYDAEGKVSGFFARPAPLEAPAWEAPAYATPAAFHETPITVSDGQWDLPGTLTLPNGKGPFATVVLVQGSGPGDQDETEGPNKLFKDLAWGLASHGVAVVRYVKRANKYGVNSRTVKGETIDDATAAVALAARQPEIDPHRVYVLGHSLGGYLAPRIAAGNPQVAGLVIFAGPSRPLPEVAMDQFKYLATLPPEVGGVPAAAVTQMEVEVAAIDNPTLKPDQGVAFLGTTLPGAYFLDLRGYQPAAMAAHLHIPMLVLQGGRDYNVTKVDYDGWQKGLAGRSDVKFDWFPALDHLFMTAPGGGLVTPHDYTIAGHVDPAVISAIADWIQHAQ